MGGFSFSLANCCSPCTIHITRSAIAPSHPFPPTCWGTPMSNRFAASCGGSWLTMAPVAVSKGAAAEGAAAGEASICNSSIVPGRRTAGVSAAPVCAAVISSRANPAGTSLVSPAVGRPPWNNSAKLAVPPAIPASERSDFAACGKVMPPLTSSSNCCSSCGVNCINIACNSPENTFDRSSAPCSRACRPTHGSARSRPGSLPEDGVALPSSGNWNM